MDRLLHPDEAARLLGIGRTKVYELMRSGRLEFVRIDTCRRVPMDALVAYVDRLRAQTRRTVA